MDVYNVYICIWDFIFSDHRLSMRCLLVLVLLLPTALHLMVTMVTMVSQSSLELLKQLGPAFLQTQNVKVLLQHLLYLFDDLVLSGSSLMVRSKSRNLLVLECPVQCICSSCDSARSMKQPWWSAFPAWAQLQLEDGPRETSRALRGVWPWETSGSPACWWGRSQRNFPTTTGLSEDLQLLQLLRFLSRTPAVSRGISQCTSWLRQFCGTHPLQLAVLTFRTRPSQV